MRRWGHGLQHRADHVLGLVADVAVERDLVERAVFQCNHRTTSILGIDEVDESIARLTLLLWVAGVLLDGDIRDLSEGSEDVPEHLLVDDEALGL